jgi:hypothetical protein
LVRALLSFFARTRIDECRVAVLASLASLDQRDCSLQALLGSDRALAIEVFESGIAAATADHNVQVRELAFVVSSTSLPALLAESDVTESSASTAQRWWAVAWGAIADASRMELPALASAFARGGHALVRALVTQPADAALLSLLRHLQLVRLLVFFLRHDAPSLRADACEAATRALDMSLTSTLRADDAIFLLLRSLSQSPSLSLPAHRSLFVSWLEELGANTAACVTVSHSHGGPLHTLPRDPLWPVDLCGGRDFVAFSAIITHQLVVLDGAAAIDRAHRALTVLENHHGKHSTPLLSLSSSANVHSACHFYVQVLRACGGAVPQRVRVLLSLYD